MRFPREGHGTREDRGAREDTGGREDKGARKQKGEREVQEVRRRTSDEGRVESREAAFKTGSAGQGSRTALPLTLNLSPVGGVKDIQEARQRAPEARRQRSVIPTRREAIEATEEQCQSEASPHSGVDARAPHSAQPDIYPPRHIIATTTRTRNALTNNLSLNANTKTSPLTALMPNPFLAHTPPSPPPTPSPHLTPRTTNTLRPKPRLKDPPMPSFWRPGEDIDARGLCRGLGATLRLLLLLLLSTPSWADLTDDQLSLLQRERSEAAKKWAPLVFLHPDERYFPSAVHSFLKDVVPRKIPASERTPDPAVLVPMSRSLDTHTLPEGSAGEDTYLVAPIDPKCKNCPLPPFLYGDKPSSEYSPPVYAVISSCLPQKRPFRNPRHIKAHQRPPRKRRRFLFRKREGRFAFRGRPKTYTTSHSYLPPYSDPFTLTPPMAPSGTRPFPETRRSSSSTLFEAMDGTTTQIVKVYPFITLPSSTLLPPKPRHYTSSTSDQSTSASHLHSTPMGGGGRKAREIVTSSVSSETEEDPDSSGSGEAPPPEPPSPSNETEGSPEVRDVPLSLEYPPQANAIPAEAIKPPKGHRFTVTYWMFYPFSQGKEVCTSRLWFLGRVFKPRLRNKCYGEVVTLNSHVGDWEHVSIYFEDAIPRRMYVSTHTYGAYYHYDSRENVFVYKGKDTRLGLPLNPKYPPVIKMDGSHPVLYAARGSHGLWGSPGTHRYESLVPLDDKTAAGTPWETWHNIDVIDKREPGYDRPDRQWLLFHGRWGNPAYGCHRAMFGTCDLASGPTGIPLKRENFPCHLPQHPTFFPKD